MVAWVGYSHLISDVEGHRIIRPNDFGPSQLYLVFTN